MTGLRVRHVADVNPACPKWDRLPDDAQVTFVPLEAVWPRRLDVSRTRPKSETASGYTRFQNGDVVVPKITPTFEGDRSTLVTGVPTGVATGTTELHVVRPGPKVDGRYLDFLFSSAPFLSGGQAEMIGVAGQKRVPDAWLRDFPVPIADVSTQRAIADYLDTETARIDALITKKRRMIELIEDRRLTAIEALITRGSETALRRSSTGYYAEVPAAWGETPLRHLRCVVQTGPFGSQLHAEEYVEDGWPVVNPGNLKDGGIVSIPHMSVSDAKRTELARHILKAGDIVFGRRGEMGRAGLVRQAQVGWLCGTGSLRLRLTDHRLSVEYLKLLLETRAMRTYFELNSVGSTMDNLNSDIVLGMPCLLPPIIDQEAIVSGVTQATGQARSMIDLLERQSGLLVEHRQALITAAVTGELAVPGVAA